MRIFDFVARNQFFLFLFAAALLLQTGCAYYSFTGATIPAHLDTIAIPLAEDNSLSPLTTMDEDLTELLIERFVRQTRLRLETSEDDADALLTTQITRYANQPSAVTGEERATLNRITVTVSVQYVDQVEDREIVQRTFSSFQEYDPTTGGLDAEEQAARDALEDIADDIFTAATSNW